MVDPQHDFGIDRLRAGIAAPQASGHGCPPEEAERADNQQQGEIDQVCHAEGEAEDEEMAVGDVEQHGLPPRPVEPRDAVEDKLGGEDGGDAQLGKTAFGFFRMDALARFVEFDDLLFGLARRFGFGGGGGFGGRFASRFFRLRGGLLLLRRGVCRFGFFGFGHDVFLLVSGFGSRNVFVCIYRLI